MLFVPQNIEEHSRKERERLFKRMEILNAASALFAEYGYRNTTIDLIAEKAEFGKGTIYNYFSGKEDIYWAIIEEIFIIYVNALEETDANQDSFYGFLCEITRGTFSFCLDNKHAFVMITRLKTSAAPQPDNVNEVVSNYQSKVDGIYKKRVEKAIKEKEIKEVNVSSFIALYKSLLFPYVFHQMFCEAGKSIDVEVESRMIIDILFNGIKK